MLSDGDATAELNMHDDLVWGRPLRETVINNVYILYAMLF